MSSYDPGIPNGRGLVRRVVESPDPDVNLLVRVLSNDNVSLAWAKVRSNKGAPGMDNVTVEAFPEAFRLKWKEIR